jgi:hypothetical protein
VKLIYLIISFIGIALFTLGLISLAIGEEAPPASFEQARDKAIKEGKEVIEDSLIQNPDGSWSPIKVKCNIFKVGGIGELGWWTFYTIKYYPNFNNIVIVIYKPEYGTLVIFRQDIDLEGHKVFCFFIEQNHSTIAWTFIHTDDATANGMVKLFLWPMEGLLVGSKWSFTPTDEMRQGDCWPVGPQEGEK